MCGLRLRVGRWSGVEVECLRFALGVVAEGTPLEGCRVEVDVVEPSFACRSCLSELPADGQLDPCPACGALEPELTAGDELTVVEILVEDP